MRLSLVRQIVGKLGMDKAIAYSSGARIVQAVASLGTMFFIAGYLSDTEQGYYYTFGSIIAIQVFFELGLTSIITQYVAHESIHVTICKDSISGEQRYQSRLASLLRFCVKWYIVISLVLFFALLLVGFIFFIRYEDQCSTVSWRYPWVILSIATAIKLFQSPLTSYLMGVGKVKEMNAMIFYQQLSIPLITWGCLSVGLKLYALGLSVLVACVVWLIYICHKNIFKIFKILWNVPIEEHVGYMTEIFPMQWRIALSWVSGYFIFQLFNPVLFATEGAVIAGQMGMTLQVLNGIQAFSYSWISTKIPFMSGLIEMKKYKELDTNFSSILKQMIFVCITLILIMYLFFIFLWTTNYGFNGLPLYTRFLDFVPLSLLTISMFLNVIVNAWATYLRCHKKEPFLVNSITSGILCCISTLVFGHSFGLYGIVIGYTSICIGMFPWGYMIYKSKKIEWHS